MVLQPVGLEPLGVVGERVPYPEHREELHREDQDAGDVEIAREVVREPRDHDDGDEVEEQLQPAHCAVLLELLVGAQRRPLPGSPSDRHRSLHR